MTEGTIFNLEFILGIVTRPLLDDLRFLNPMCTQ